MPTISDLIRKYLRANPQGGTTEDIRQYCVKNGRDVTNKAVSRILSKFRDRGEVVFDDMGRYYVWKLP